MIPQVGTETPFCVFTSDGWILQGIEATPNATNLLVLAHGLNEDHHSYARAMAAWSGYRIVAYDARGHGKSTLRADGRHVTLPEMTDQDLLGMPNDIVAIEARFGSPYAIVGASIGANAALIASANSSVRLALLSPGLDYHGLQPAGADAAHKGPALFAASKGDGYSADSSQQLYQAHSEPRSLWIADGSAHGTNLLDENGIRAVGAWLCCQTPP